MARILSLPNYLPRTCSILIIRKPEKYEKKKTTIFKRSQKQNKKKEKRKEGKQER